MTTMDDKRILIIAGCNGAGKTTFAKEFLLQEANCPDFINADLVAAGLSPFAPEKAAIQAGRIVIQAIDRAVAAGESFAFETTLSGKGYARKIPDWRRKGYKVSLFYLKLENVEQAIERVLERVKQGGHSIPETDIRRRYAAGLSNFHKVYRNLVDHWILIDNSKRPPQILEESDYD